MVRIEQITLPCDHTEKDLKKAVCTALHITGGELKGIEIVKKSIDARKKANVHYLLTVDAELKNPSLEDRLIKKGKNLSKPVINEYSPLTVLGLSELPRNYEGLSPVVTGAGPAGLFCAYYLAKYGFKPVLIERGENIEERTKKVETFWNTGVLDTESNVQFGAGGAGTYSDGKLNTAIKDTSGRIHNVLKIFTECGAPEDILYNAKPHIGTDILKTVVSNILQKIRDMGGKVRFSTKLTDIRMKNGVVSSVILNGTEELPCSSLILAIGHSARDTFGMLLDKGIIMEQKDFALGLRIEHPQEMINKDQYGDFAGLLPAAPYKLTHTTESGRGVYSFCMCPGGFVVNASSEKGRLAVNGMSNRARNSGNANSAIIVTVGRNDFGSDDALAGVRFQEKLEKAAFDCAGGFIPQQLYKDFKEGKRSTGYGVFASCTCGKNAFANLSRILPKGITESILESMPHFARILPGFDRDDAILSGIESRTSSPVRIVRNGQKQCNISGIYPCGEGAGYAGGIVSAAVDGIKVFEAVLSGSLE